MIVVSLPTLKSTVGSIRVGLKQANTLIEQVKVKPENAEFGKKLDQFYRKANELFEEQEKKMVQAEEAYEAIVTSFAEDPKIMTPEEFFGIFDKFSSQYSVPIIPNKSKPNSRTKQSK